MKYIVEAYDGNSNLTERFVSLDESAARRKYDEMKEKNRTEHAAISASTTDGFSLLNEVFLLGGWRPYGTILRNGELVKY